MRSAALALLLVAAGCPRTGPGADEPEPPAADGGTGVAGDEALAGLLEGPLSADEAAAQLLQVEVDPGRAVVILHCSFPEAWVAAVPLELADGADVDLVRSVVVLGADPDTTTHVPQRDRLEPHAAVACAPDGVLQVAPGSWQLVAGRRDRLRTREGAAAAWLDVVELAAGDRLEFYLGSDDLTLDVPVP
ncbi:MAG: hypothetical protein JXB32_00335 [Deltaproteobacteria bacterium]|nr:hypothetical protein [Deltaproteobacteria bacterium]